MSERCAARCLRFAARTRSIRCEVIEVERVCGMRYRVQQDPGQKQALLPQ
jgi:hypothetical protein